MLTSLTLLSTRTNLGPYRDSSTRLTKSRNNVLSRLLDYIVIKDVSQNLILRKEDDRSLISLK